MIIAWSKRVKPDFLNKVREICASLGMNPNHLMACMAFESGETFSPSVKNAAGSGAVGLIQFMPSTAHALGTDTDRLATMTGVNQLCFVKKYFEPSRGRLNTLEDVYMAILWPAAVGKPAEVILFDSSDKNHPKQYVQNAGLDIDKNGVITKYEAAECVRKKLAKGLLPENCFPDVIANKDIPDAKGLEKIKT